MSLVNLLRKVSIRGLKEALVQFGRIEGLDDRDNVQRFQDYGFAAMPVDGEGLRIEVGGHAVIIRMDRLAERPQLAAYEVCVWHKDGHKITLGHDGTITADCTEFVVNASARVVLNTPVVQGAGDAHFVGTVTGDEDVVFGGISGVGHRHGGVSFGGSQTSTPV